MAGTAAVPVPHRRTGRRDWEPTERQLRGTCRHDGDNRNDGNDGDRSRRRHRGSLGDGSDLGCGSTATGDCGTTSMASVTTGSAIAGAGGAGRASLSGGTGGIRGATGTGCGLRAAPRRPVTIGGGSRCGRSDGHIRYDRRRARCGKSSHTVYDVGLRRRRNHRNSLWDNIIQRVCGGLERLGNAGRFGRQLLHQIETRHTRARLGGGGTTPHEERPDHARRGRRRAGQARNCGWHDFLELSTVPTRSGPYRVTEVAQVVNGPTGRGDVIAMKPRKRRRRGPAARARRRRINKPLPWSATRDHANAPRQRSTSAAWSPRVSLIGQPVNKRRRSLMCRQVERQRRWCLNLLRRSTASWMLSLRQSTVTPRARPPARGKDLGPRTPVWSTWKTMKLTFLI